MIDEKNAISHAGEPTEKEVVFASSSFHYIKRRHWAYLWMFRMRMSVDINDKTGTVTILHYKFAFGKQFILGEQIRKFE